MCKDFVRFLIGFLCCNLFIITLTFIIFLYDFGRKPIMSTSSVALVIEEGHEE